MIIISTINMDIQIHIGFLIHDKLKVKEMYYFPT
jgi:hypothetical protein